MVGGDGLRQEGGNRVTCGRSGRDGPEGHYRWYLRQNMDAIIRVVGGPTVLVSSVRSFVSSNKQT